MKPTTLFASSAAAVLALTAVLAQSGQSQVQQAQPGYVRLQDSTPGTVQTGNSNISGTMKAGQFVGDGSGITGLNAGNVTSGQLGIGQLPADVARKSVANTFTATNQFDGFVGIKRNTPVTGSEVFGIGNGSMSGFAGMYSETGPSGKPFYGYSLNGAISAYHYLDSTNGAWKLNVNSGDRLIVNGNGDVGIGGPPNSRLSVQGGDFRISDANGKLAHFMGIGDAGERYMEIDSATNHTAILARGPNAASESWLGVMDTTGYSAAFMYTGLDGKGYISADVKNFRVPNPRNDAEDIYYACVEGPEAAAYVRGTGRMVNGIAHIDLPEHFSDVTVSNGMTVQLTAKSPQSKGLGYWHGSNLGFDVFELNGGKGTYEFDWEVKCVREGHEDYKVVRPWTDAAPGNLDTARAWQARLASIHNAQNRVKAVANRP